MRLRHVPPLPVPVPRLALLSVLAAEEQDPARHNDAGRSPSLAVLC